MFPKTSARVISAEERMLSTDEKIKKCLSCTFLTPLAIAARDYDVHIIHALLQTLNPTKESQKTHALLSPTGNCSPLMCELHFGNVETLEALLKFGAKPELVEFERVAFSGKKCTNALEYWQKSAKKKINELYPCGTTHKERAHNEPERLRMEACLYLIEDYLQEKAINTTSTTHMKALGGEKIDEEAQLTAAPLGEDDFQAGAGIRQPRGIEPEPTLENQGTQLVL